MDTREVDLVVIGAGPVGENLADRAHQAGLSTIIVERELVGGECSYWACMPSKALLRANAVLHAARDVDGAQQAIGEIDVAGVLRRRDRATSEYDDAGQVGWLESAGIELLRGHGRISGIREVTIERDGEPSLVVRAKHAVAVAPGSASRLPDIPGLTDAAPWSNREATAVTELPASLAVIGGGVVAVELATAFASLGTEVTVIARSGILGNVEPFAAALAERGLQDAGVTIVRASPVRVERDGEVSVLLDNGATIRASELLVAAGRVARSADLGLESVGITAGGESLHDDGSIIVDDTMRVEGTDWLYAVGDVNGRALLTHQGKYQARAAGDVIAARARGTRVDDAPWGKHVATADHVAVPQVIFSQPEIASVGMTEREATSAGLRVRTLDYDLANVAGASLQGDHYEGHARAVVDLDRRVIVGLTFAGPDVAEMLQAATIAVVGEVPIDRLWHAVPAYPTVSEIWLRLLESFGRDA